MSSPSTLLVISPIGLPSYACRGIKQTLSPSSGSSNLRRDVNGTLVDLTPPQLKKYKTTITCDDMESPSLDGVFPGSVVTIDCVSELSYLTAGGSPQRAVVPGSTRAEGDFTYYRPQLVMLVTDYEMETDEWGAKVSWRLDAEEQ